METGWLIEHLGFSIPLYVGESCDPSRAEFAWTSNPLLAIRFARKIDAERCARSLQIPARSIQLGGVNWEAREHAWCDPLTEKTSPAT